LRVRPKDGGNGLAPIPVLDGVWPLTFSALLELAIPFMAVFWKSFVPLGLSGHLV